MNIDAKAQKIIDEFNGYSSWEERYKLLIVRARNSETLSSSLQIDKYKVKGCQSQVWLVPKLEGGKLIFRADSDAVLVKGIANLLVEVYSGYSPKDILGFEPSFLEEIGINQHLSMNRTNGLRSMIKQIGTFAMLTDGLVQRGIQDADI